MPCGDVPPQSFVRSVKRSRVLRNPTRNGFTMPGNVPTHTLLERSSQRLVTTAPRADWSLQTADVESHNVTPGLEWQTPATSDTSPDALGVAIVIAFVMLLVYVALGFGVALVL